jgi:DNA-directed RNA polymerase specialized sigma24 family protein
MEVSRMTEAQKQRAARCRKVLELRALGLTTRQIGRALGLSHDTAARYLRYARAILDGDSPIDLAPARAPADPLAESATALECARLESSVIDCRP